MKKFYQLIWTIPKREFQRQKAEQKFGLLWDKLTLWSVSRFFRWLVALMGILIAYIIVFINISPLVQIGALIFFQCFILTLFFRNGKLSPVFKGKKLNFIVFVDEILLLLQRIFVLVYWICEEMDLQDIIVITAGWLIILPKLISQIMWLGYLGSTIHKRKKALMKKLRMFVLLVQGKKVQRIQKLKMNKVKVSPATPRKDIYKVSV